MALTLMVHLTASRQSIPHSASGDVAALSQKMKKCLIKLPSCQENIKKALCKSSFICFWVQKFLRLMQLYEGRKVP